jgi:hypothetical protein
MQVLDSARIEQLVRELVAAAGRVGDRRQVLHGAAQRLGWHSPAATAFEAMLSGTLGQLADVERRLDGLARQLREHAERAAQRAETAARMARTAIALSRSMVRPPW